MKKIVWALYDDASRSVFNAVYSNEYLNEKYEVYSFGINDKENEPNYKKIDLSVFNEKIIKELEKFAKVKGLPDIIFASPPCKSWSVANPGKNFKETIIADQKDTIYLHLRNFNFYEKQNAATTFAKWNFYRECSSRLLGEATAIATKRIIEHFKPKLFFIENPGASRIFNYFEKFLSADMQKLYKNKFDYGAYDENSPKKPTIFLSNHEFTLKTTKRKCIKWEKVSGYKTRSAIPKGVIHEFFKQIEEKGLTNANS